MVMTPSQMLPLGSRAPEFELPDPRGKMISLDHFGQVNAYLVVFMCNHCPFVVHIRGELANIGREYIPRGVAMFGINSNDISKYPEDNPENMVREAKKQGYVFPYLFDEDQSIAKAYYAACTPDFFLFDRQKKLVYRGQLDDSRPSNGVPVTGKDLRAALDAVLSDDKVPEVQKPSIGCNIKWKPGNAPTYFAG